jgi:hypothetical protein
MPSQTIAANACRQTILNLLRTALTPLNDVVSLPGTSEIFQILASIFAED